MPDSEVALTDSSFVAVNGKFSWFSKHWESVWVFHNQLHLEADKLLGN